MKRTKHTSLASTLAAGLLWLGVAGTGCEGEMDPTTTLNEHAATAPGPQAARPPAALPHDERAESPGTPNRPPRVVPRLDDDVPTTREQLAGKGRLSAQEAAGKLPKQAQREPSTARPLAGMDGQPPADLAARYQRYQQEWKALEAASQGMTAQQREAQREALKRTLVDGRP